MVSLLANSVKVLLWSCVLLATIVMIYALIFIQALTQYRIDNNEKAQDPQIVGSFGNLPTAMMTLFQSTTGGADWSDAYNLTSKAGDRAAQFWFVTFIIFFEMAMINLISSMFVDKASKSGQPEDDEGLQEKLAEERKDKAQLRRLIESMDTDQSGMISMSKLEEGLKKQKIKELFEIQNLKIADAKLFFRTISTQCPFEGIPIEAFVEGAMKVRGFASSLDVQAMKMQLAMLTDLVRAVGERLEVPVLVNGSLATPSSRLSMVSGRFFGQGVLV